MSGTVGIAVFAVAELRGARDEDDREISGGAA